MKKPSDSSIHFLLGHPGFIPKILEMMEAFYAIDDYPFDGQNAEATLRHFLENENLGRLWLIQSGSQIVGYIVLTFGFSFEYSGKDAFIDELLSLIHI